MASRPTLLRMLQFGTTCQYRSRTISNVIFATPTKLFFACLGMRSFHAAPRVQKPGDSSSLQAGFYNEHCPDCPGCLSIEAQESHTDGCSEKPEERRSNYANSSPRVRRVMQPRFLVDDRLNLLDEHLHDRLDSAA